MHVTTVKRSDVSTLADSNISTLRPETLELRRRRRRRILESGEDVFKCGSLAAHAHHYYLDADDAIWSRIRVVRLE